MFAKREMCAFEFDTTIIRQIVNNFMEKNKVLHHSSKFCHF